MSRQQAAAKQQQPPGAISSSDQDLAARIGRLEARLDEQKNSDSGFVKRAAVVLGVLGGLLALPKASVDTYNSLLRQPKTAIVAEHPLSVTYDSTSELLRFESVVLFQNNGNAADGVRVASAQVKSQESIDAQEVINNTDIQFVQNNSILSVPVVEPNQPLPVTVSISASVPPAEAVTILSGAHRIDIAMKMFRQKPVLSYCYSFDNKQASDIVAAKPKRLLTPSCT